MCVLKGGGGDAREDSPSVYLCVGGVERSVGCQCVRGGKVQ